MNAPTTIPIAFAILASAGWLAFAREWKAHRETKNALADAAEMESHWWAEFNVMAAKLARLTDRDERGRFVKRERV